MFYKSLDFNIKICLVVQIGFGGDKMVRLVPIVALVGIMTMASLPVSACNTHGKCEHGAPVPIAGVGLPFLLGIGYGAFWLVKRRRIA